MSPAPFPSFFYSIILGAIEPASTQCTGTHKKPSMKAMLGLKNPPTPLPLLPPPPPPPTLLPLPPFPVGRGRVPWWPKPATNITLGPSTTRWNGANSCPGVPCSPWRGRTWRCRSLCATCGTSSTNASLVSYP